MTLRFYPLHTLKAATQFTPKAVKTYSKKSIKKWKWKKWKGKVKKKWKWKKWKWKSERGKSESEHGKVKMKRWKWHSESENMKVKKMNVKIFNESEKCNFLSSPGVVGKWMVAGTLSSGYEDLSGRWHPSSQEAHTRQAGCNVVLLSPPQTPQQKNLKASQLFSFETSLLMKQTFNDFTPAWTQKFDRFSLGISY